MIIPFETDRKAAEALESSELESNIKECWLGNELFETNWLAKYGIICGTVMLSRGLKPPIEPSKFMPLLRGVPERPRWVSKYLGKHRAYLVLLGWVRHLGPESMDLVREAKSPLELLEKFEGFPIPGVRQYAEFEELPAAYRLYP